MVRFVVLCAVAAGVTLAAQAQFRSSVSTVAVYATVSDRDGRLVPGLSRDAFQILDDGTPVETTVFSNERQTITVALMLDMSGSMTNRLLWLREASNRFVDALEGADRASIGTFGEEVAVSPHLTGDKGRLKRILNDELWPGGATPLWSGIDAAMQSLGSQTGRRVVLVVSDGLDTASRGVGASDVTDRGLAGAFMVYAVSADTKGIGVELQRLAEDTGGGHVSIGSDAELGPALERVAEELRHQYMLGFTPARLDGKLHKLTVRMVPPGMKARVPKRFLAPEK